MHNHQKKGLKAILGDILEITVIRDIHETEEARVSSLIEELRQKKT